MTDTAVRMAGSCRFQVTRPGFQLDAGLDIPAHGITGIYGHSGSGKTTLLRCIAGLEPDAIGQLQVGDARWHDSERKLFVRPEQRNIAYVFQDGRLFPHLNVARNLAYGHKRRRPGANGVDTQQVVELLGLGKLLPRMPRELSGGEQQRVAMARALLRAPSLVLMDEPLASLDPQRREEILPFLDRLHAELSLPLLYVSHSLYEMTRLCDRLALMAEGRVLASGPLNEVLTRPDLPIAQSDQAASIIDGTIDRYDQNYDLTYVRFSGGELVSPGQQGAAGEAARIRILSHDVSLCRERPPASTILNLLDARVIALHPAPGAFVSVSLALGEANITARVTRHSVERLGLEPGQAVIAQIKGVAVRRAGSAILA